VMGFELKTDEHLFTKSWNCVFHALGVSDSITELFSY
jgi:hypothetical protein